VLPIICTALLLHLGHDTAAAHVLSKSLRYGRVAQQLVETWTEFQQSVVYDANDQWRKRLEACIHAEGGH